MVAARAGRRGLGARLLLRRVLVGARQALLERRALILAAGDAAHVEQVYDQQRREELQLVVLGVAPEAGRDRRLERGLWTRGAMRRVGGGLAAVGG